MEFEGFGRQFYVLGVLSAGRSLKDVALPQIPMRLGAVLRGCPFFKINK